MRSFIVEFEVDLRRRVCGLLKDSHHIMPWFFAVKAKVQCKLSNYRGSCLDSEKRSWTSNGKTKANCSIFYGLSIIVSLENKQTSFNRVFSKIFKGSERTETWTNWWQFAGVNMLEKRDFLQILKRVPVDHKSFGGRLWAKFAEHSGIHTGRSIFFLLTMFTSKNVSQFYFYFIWENLIFGTFSLNPKVHFHLNKFRFVIVIIPYTYCKLNVIGQRECCCYYRM